MLWLTYPGDSISSIDEGEKPGVVKITERVRLFLKPVGGIQVGIPAKGSVSTYTLCQQAEDIAYI